MTKPTRQASDAFRAEIPARDAQLGPRVRDVRRGQGVALTALAERAGLSKGFLSRFERGQVSVSVAALLRICDVLQIGTQELFSASSANLVRGTDVPRVAFGGIGLTEYQLTPTSETRMQVLLTEIAPGGGSGDEPYKLPVELEYAHVIKGRVVISVNGEEASLDAGDSLLFASEPHTFRNDGPDDATLMWVLMPAIFAGDGADIDSAADQSEVDS